MKLLFVLAIALAAVSANQFYMRGGNRHPDHPNKCYYADFKKVLEIGEEYKPVGECVKAVCQEDYVMAFNSCPKQMAPSNCVLSGQDLTKTFPDCCEQVKCN